AGSALNALFQQALRVGKRAHAETDIDRASPSVVAAALERAADHLGGLAGRRAVVVGAGAMASLSVATLSRAGIGEIVVANRTPERASHLADGYAATVVGLERLESVLGHADLLVSCTGSAGVVVPVATLVRAAGGSRLAVVDLALPHDVDPAAAA